MGSKKRAPVQLDVDSSILGNQLRLKDSSTDELSTLFPDSGKAAVPWKLVTPSPGFCVKFRTKDDDEKVFINICHTAEIPAPEDKTEQELLELWQSPADTCDYRIPMSIGERRTELDKSNEPASVYDVAINSNFFAKLESSQPFRLFVIQVASQGVQEKFAIEFTSEEFVTLKKRKVFGTLQQHRIQIRSADRSKPSVPLIQELGSKPVRGEGTGDGSPPVRQPPSRIFHDPSTNQLIAQFFLQGIISSREVTLDLGEDRVVLTAARIGLRTDYYLPYNVNQTNSEAVFDPVSEMLTVKMPITCN